MGFADLHIHSMYSFDGTASISAILKYAADFTQLDVIAITDHDTMDGVQEALDLAPKYNLEVVPGCEVSTKDGHVLALYIKKPIPTGLSFFETVIKIGEQGGLCIAAHPMAKGMNSLGFNMIRSIRRNPEIASILVGVEVFNGSLIYTKRNKLVVDECRKLAMSHVGNSDAHTLTMLGQGYSLFKGHTAQDLRFSLQNQLTIPLEGKGVSGISVLAAYIPHILLRKLGWVSWNANPDSKLGYARLSHLMAGHLM